MKSKITIEIDFENNNRPVIQILSRPSDDVRDKLLSTFVQSLRHVSRWCTIDYIDGVEEGNGERTHRWHIVPVKEENIFSEIKLMEAVLTGEQKIIS